VEHAEGATGLQTRAAAHPDPGSGTASRSPPAQQRPADPAAEPLQVFQDEAAPTEGLAQAHAALEKQAPDEPPVAAAAETAQPVALAPDGQAGAVGDQAERAGVAAAPVEGQAADLGDMAGGSRERKKRPEEESDLTRSFKLAAGFAWAQSGTGEESDEEEEGGDGAEAGKAGGGDRSPGVSFLDPTIHTKEALQDILGFFANPLSCEKPSKPGRTGHSPNPGAGEGEGEGGGSEGAAGAGAKDVPQEPALLPSSRPDPRGSNASAENQAAPVRGSSGAPEAQARPSIAPSLVQKPGADPSSSQHGNPKAPASDELFVYEDGEEEGRGLRATQGPLWFWGRQ